MDFQNIRIFVMCAKYLSFSRVAELTYTSQPSVSKCISALEAEVGGALFVRNSRKMELTALGEALLPYAESILSKEDEFRGFLHQYHTGQDIHPLVVGISSLLMASLPESLLLPVVNAVDQFQMLYSDTKVKVRYFDEDKLKEMVATGRVDLAVTAINKTHLPQKIQMGYNYLCLDETENFLLFSPALGEFDTLENLLPRLDCLLSVSDQMAMSVTYDFLSKVNAPLRVEPCDNWSDAVIRCKNGQGATILGSTSARLAIRCGVSYFSLTDMDIMTSLCAIWKRDGNDHIRNFAVILRSCFSDIFNQR